MVGPAAGIEDQTDFAAHLMHASQSLRSEPALLAAAILLLDDALRRCPRKHPRRLRYLFDLSQAYSARYDTSDDPADLRNALTYGERVRTAYPPRAHDWSDILYHLSMVYRKRYELLGRRTDLDRAIRLSKTAVRSSGADSHAGQSTLAWLYGLRYDRAGDVEDLERAIRHAEQAVAATPQHDRHRPGYQHNLAVIYRKRHERTGNVADLDRAIELGEQIDATAPPDHPVRLINLSSLGLAWRERFEITSDFAALNRAVEVGEQAVAAVPKGTAAWTGFVANLSESLSRRYRHGGDPADLQRTDCLAEVAPDESTALSDSPVQQDDAAELDLAVESETGMLARLPKHSPARPRHLANLSSLHSMRYLRLGVLVDLVRSVELAEQAVLLTPTDHPDRAARLAKLTPAYGELFDRTAVPEQLARAIAAGEQAIADTPEGHCDYGHLLSDLSIVYGKRYVRDRQAADIDRAIELGQQALAVTPDTYSERASILSNLASDYGTRHRRDGNSTDLDRAIELYEQALAVMPDDHRQRATLVANLAHAYKAGYDTDPDGFAPARLRDLLRTTAELTAIASDDRARLGFAVGTLALAVGEPATAMTLLDDAVAALPSVAPRQGEWVDQEFRLGSYAGLIGAAISAHCANNDAEGALAVAELGRGIMAASRLNLRTDLTELARAEPGLARELELVRGQLNAIDTLSASSTELARHTERRSALWTRHDALLAEIRRVPRFEQFLLPPSLPDLRAASAGGAIVLVNAHEHRSDAVIATADADPYLVELPDLRFSDVLHHSGALLETTHVPGLANTLRKQRLVPEVLEWLWDTVVGPVIAALPTQRVWWMPTGLLGVLPLHAAGRPGQPGALDLVTSSYTTTMRTLADARARTPGGDRRQLTVALSHTPGLPDLPGTVAEADEVQNQWPALEPLRDDRATMAAVLAALPKATWAHFACHASANPMFPTAGGLHLHDGVLSTPAIAQLRLRGAELAYLSACSTGNRGVRAEDESAHPASAFQLAGFRHVIASLWPLEDRSAAAAARAFYQYVEQERPAHALRRVTMDLRDACPARPDLWASLVHIGP